MATSMNIAGVEASISQAQCRIKTIKRDIEWCQHQITVIKDKRTGPLDHVEKRTIETRKNQIKKDREEIAKLRENIKRDKERLKELKSKK